MGPSPFGRSCEDRPPQDLPCRLAPRFRFRVVLKASKDAPAAFNSRPHAGGLQGLQVVWATNDLAYARSLAEQLSAFAPDCGAGVDAWNHAENPAQSRWIRLRPDGPRG